LVDWKVVESKPDIFLEVFTFISDDRYFNDRYFYDHYFLAEEWGGQSERVVFSRSDFDFVF